MRKLAIAATLATLAAPAGAQELPRTLYSWEKAWFDRWGVTAEELRALRDVKTRDPFLRKQRVAHRFRELAAASAQGDQVARMLVSAELNRRCNGGRRIRRDYCAAYADFLRHRSWPVKPYSMAVRELWPNNFRVWGDENRFLEIGRMFELGVGGAVDYGLATYFYRAAAEVPDEQVNAAAHYHLGVMAEKGLGRKADRAAAYDYYRQAAFNGHPMATYLVGLEEIRRPPDGSYGSYGSAATSLRFAADKGIADAAYRYALLLYEGKVGVNRGKDNRRPDAATTCFTYFRKAALAGHVRAMTMLGRTYARGLGVREDGARAEDWWRKAARAGDPEAAWLVAAAHSRRGDHPGGLPWLKRAAAGNYPGARAELDKWVAAGVREKSLLGSLLSVFEFLGDVAVAYEQQRQAQIAADNAFWANYTNVGSWGAGSGGAEGSSAGAGAGGGGDSADGGADGGSSDSDLAAVNAVPDADGSGGGAGSATDADGSGGGSLGAGSSGSAGGSGGGNGGASGEGSAAGQEPSGSGSASGGGTRAAIIIEEDKAHKQWLASLEQQKKDMARQLAKEAADRARAEAAGRAEHERAMAEIKRRREAADIACHGSLEAAKKAKASCQ